MLVVLTVCEAVYYVFLSYASVTVNLDYSSSYVITLRTKLSGAVYCNRSCLFVCLFVGLFACFGSVTTITRNCVHRSSPNWVCGWR